jgi:hypothetical protein
MSFPDGGWSSHLEALAWAFVQSEGTVVEYGGGWYSTPMLHGLCEATGRRLVTCEPDPYMHGQLTQGWANDWHEVRSTNAFGVGAGLVFIDSGANERAPLLTACRQVEFVVVHDTEPESVKSYPDMHRILGQYRYRRDWRVYPWWTSVVSDRVNVAAL